MAIITKTIAIDVMKVVTVVELPARSGILSRLLLIIIKNNLAAKAKVAPKRKCQSKSILIIAIGVKLEPLMKEREPVSKIEMTVTSENKMV
ncbi:MAG TPA: hypothetical protein DEA43_00335 [Candidatus Moranbacteria bacterium]|nr:hypothetical protein [Candidatus Moranbacteria bacterium]HBT45319.1 hypothetical protein [Candidatus Moranbacteria bacterium]